VRAVRSDAGQKEWIAVAPDLRTLMRRIDLLAAAQPSLEATRQALEQHDIAAAREGLKILAASAHELRAALIDAYQQTPGSLAVQTALGIVCLAANRHREGLFHLLRATPGQAEWFAVCRRYHLFRSSPVACRQLLLCIGATELLGRKQEAELLHKTLRMGVRLLRLAAAGANLKGDLLWTRPDVLVHVRGVIEVGTVPATVAGLREVEVPRVLAFAKSVADETALIGTLATSGAAIPAWQVVGLRADGRTPAYELDTWFAAGPSRAADFNLLRIGPSIDAHALLGAGHVTLRGIDFVSALVPATPRRVAAAAAEDEPDEATLPGLLASMGFVELAATEDDVVPRQALYVRAEHV
jgi:hypothetical protein